MTTKFDYHQVFGTNLIKLELLFQVLLQVTLGLVTLVPLNKTAENNGTLTH